MEKEKAAARQIVDQFVYCIEKGEQVKGGGRDRLEKICLSPFIRQRRDIVDMDDLVILVHPKGLRGTFELGRRYRVVVEEVPEEVPEEVTERFTGL